MAALVLEYYLVLRSVLRSRPHLRKCLTRCRHCRIFFLTHPRNAGRHDLGCPFGCRLAHRKQESTRRSVENNRSKQGKIKKNALNNRRRLLARASEPIKIQTAAVARPEVTSPGWDVTMVEHVRMVISLIENRRVSREEILAMLAKQMRQHTMGRRPKVDHTVAWLNEHAP